MVIQKRKGEGKGKGNCEISACNEFSVMYDGSIRLGDVLSIALRYVDNQ